MARRTARAASSKHEELARAALGEITAPSNVGDWVEDRVREDRPGVVDVVYASTQTGYRGWSWIVSVVESVPSDSGETLPPTVLELGLLPGDDALLAPEWVPWSVRLAEWQAQQAAAEAEAAAAEVEADDADADAPDADDGDEDDGDEDDGDDDGDDDGADDDAFDDDDDDDLDDDDEFEDDSDDDDPLDDDVDEHDLPTMADGDLDGVDLEEVDELDLEATDEPS